MTPQIKPTKAMIIRRLGTLAAIGVAGYAGFMKRPAVMIPLLAVVFTVIFVANKWTMVKMMRSMSGGKGLNKLAAAAFMAQLFFVVIVFLIGRMFGAIFQDYGSPVGMVQNDWTLLGGLLAFGVLVSVIASRFQTDPMGDMMSQMQAMMSQMQGGAAGGGDAGANPFADMFNQMQKGGMRDVTPDVSASPKAAPPKNSLRKPKNLN